VIGKEGLAQIRKALRGLRDGGTHVLYLAGVDGTVGMRVELSGPKPYLGKRKPWIVSREALAVKKPANPLREFVQKVRRDVALAPVESKLVFQAPRRPYEDHRVTLEREARLLAPIPDHSHWPKEAYGPGRCSKRGLFYSRGPYADSREFGPPATIWHSFGERVFEREMKIRWKRGG